MKLEEGELEHLESLARIRLDGEAREKLREQLAGIIEFVRQLQEIDTSGYEAKAYLGGFEPVLRADEIESCLSREEVLAESPDSENGYFKVPPVIDAE